MISASFSHLLTLRPEGLYCPAGDFYIDPWRPVARAIITHAHGDHARWGCDRYMASRNSAPFLKQRLGKEIHVHSSDFGEISTIGSSRVSLHPAGHILGSAQVRIEVDNQVAVVTGDYKIEPDVTCESFEPLRCDLLVTESTFGLPIFQWPRTPSIADEINAWWRSNQSAGKASLLYGYALGKSQRLLSLLDPSLGPIFIHGALIEPTRLYREAGIAIPPTQVIQEAPQDFDWSRSIIVAVPSAHGTPWLRRFGDISTAMASGWMMVRGNRRRRSLDRGFVLSDHADWPSLLETIGHCQPQEVWVTHGFVDIFARYLCELGFNAKPLRTEFRGEELISNESDEEQA